MKIKCINLGDYAHITIGKIYDASEFCLDEYYILINDQDIKIEYPKILFKSLSKVRNEKIDKSLSDK